MSWNIILFVSVVIVAYRWRKKIKEIVHELGILYRLAKAYAMIFYLQKSNTTVHDEFAKIVKKFPTKVCIFFENEKWTFAEVDAYANRVANYFSEQGLVKGDKVGIFMENRVEYICMWLGLAKIGVVSALINTNLRNNALSHCLKTGKCNSIIFGSELTSAVKEIKDQGLLEDITLYNLNGAENSNSDSLPDAKDLNTGLDKSSKKAPFVKERVNYNDELMYIYTSGTTGFPKAAIIKHSRYLTLATGTTYSIGLTENDIFSVPLPLYHVSGTVVGVAQALLGGASVVVPKKFSASRFWDECRKHNVTAFQYIGELCRFLLAQPKNSKDKDHSVRQMYGNGMKAEIWPEFVERFNIKNVFEVYASTEGNCGLMNYDNKVGSVGRMPTVLAGIAPVQLIKVDEDIGEPIRDPVTGLCIKCGVNEAGELIGIIKGGNPVSDFTGYTDEKAKNKKIITDVFTKGDRAFRSGDILLRDDEGFYYFKDRQGDTFRWKGENVSTCEVESIVGKACGLRDAAVYGVEIPKTDGRAGMAAIVDPEDSLDMNLLASELCQQLPSYARPIFIRKLKEMDLTGTFKLKKGDLQKDGFDMEKVKDPIYFYANGAYTRLDSETYTKIMQGQIRI